jgi:cell division protein FtsI/penicillin-binding protein 2
MRDLAPTAAFARPMLGSVGEATAEIIEASAGRIEAGDITGLSGLQRYYDEQLAGTPGLVVAAPNRYGDASRELFRIEPVAGVDLETTFEVAAQEKAEAILAGVEPAAAIVAIRVSTGEVIVAANGPGSGSFNTALLGQYPPGSTFKVVDALAFHRNGIGADTPVQCPETIEVDGRVFQNVPGYPAAVLGEVPFRVAFANSCNTAFIGQAGLAPERDLAAAGADLGLGVYAPVGIGTYFGDVPPEATGTGHAANLLGQGTVQASPFAMARVAASVAAGHRVDPVLVRSVVRAADAAAPEQPAPPPSALSADEATFLRELMGAVVSEGSAGILADIPGIVGAKTGTAQFGDGSQSHTWMIAIMGDYAVAVFVEVGEFGATTSGPIMREFLQYLATQ